MVVHIFRSCKSKGDNKRMMKSMLGCCKLYISESRNAVALDAIEQTITKFHPDIAIVNKFKDTAYNRVGYTLVSDCADNISPETYCPMRKAVFEMVTVAFKSIDLQLHSGSHPRLGVVDHICFHPLAKASINQMAAIAKLVGADIANNLQVPTFLYGAASDNRRSLNSIRRDLNYFKPNSTGNQWVGGLNLQTSNLKPDMGPSEVPKDKGIMVIGATKWVDNYNVPILSTDISIARRIAKRVSSRGGGLESVQAMALAHGDDCIEVACNLLDPDKVGADQVQRKVELLAANGGLMVGKGYYTDLSQEKIVADYIKLTARK